MKNRYDGIFTLTLFEGGQPETHRNRLDAGTRAVLGAIWREYDYYAHRGPLSFERMNIVVGVARDAMAYLVEGPEHIHTDACLFDHDCPVFKAGYETAQEMLFEWADPELLR